jgi:ABC-type dipeptide/oligopeptide/nickel transport system permease component
MSAGDDGLYRGDPPPPGHAPPQYGPPGYGPPPLAFHRPRTNSTAVLALVLAFVIAPVGIVLGVLARKEIRRTGEEGDGLALAGIIVGSVVTAFWALLILFWIIAFASLTGSFGP